MEVESRGCAPFSRRSIPNGSRLQEERTIGMSQADPTPEEVTAWHRARLRVPLFEVDLGQAVYHGNYFHLFELAREELLRELGYPYRRFMDGQMHLTVVEATCAYRRSVHYDEWIEVHTGVLWVRSRSLAFCQKIFREGEDAHPVLCTRATLNMVCVRFTGQPTMLPREFLDRLEAWMQGKKEESLSVENL